MSGLLAKIRSMLLRRTATPETSSEDLPGTDITESLKMGHLVLGARALMQQFPDESLACLEIGTIRSYDEQHESTRHLAETLGERGHVTSVDVSEDAITVAKDICRHLGNITWHHTDSLSYLRSCQQSGASYHFILLDGANDRDLNFEEFKLAMPLLRDGGLLFVDDAGVSTDLTVPDPTQPGAEKGIKIFEFLRDHDVAHAIVQSRQGTQLQLVKGAWGPDLAAAASAYGAAP